MPRRRIGGRNLTEQKPLVPGADTPISPSVPDNQNPDTNHPDVMKKDSTSPTGVVRDDKAGSPIPRADSPDTKTTPKPTTSVTPTPTDANTATSQSGDAPANSEKEVDNSHGIQGGSVIRVQPMNTDREIIGHVLGVNKETGIGEVAWLENLDTKHDHFKAEDAEIIEKEPPVPHNERSFINDDKTYDARELRMERPRNEKKPVQKQEVLRERTADSNFSLSQNRR